MTDLQELIAMGPLKAKRSIPTQVLSPEERRLRESERPERKGGFSAADVQALVAAGLDPEASSLRRLALI